MPIAAAPAAAAAAAAAAAVPGPAFRSHSPLAPATAPPKVRSPQVRRGFGLAQKLDSCSHSPPIPSTSPPEVRSPQVGRGLALVQRHSDCQFLEKNYTTVRRIGHGAFGCVDLVQNIASGEEKVCKRVNVAGMKNDLLRQMRMEIRVLSRLDHPNIVKIFEFAEDADKGELMLILEYIPGGNCRSLLKQEGGLLPEATAARLVYQLLVALSYCHEHGIVHRDIKPENMMVSRRRLIGTLDCKVIDFGLAARESGAEEYSASWGGAMGKHQGIAQRGIAQRAGTPVYMSPEIVDCRVSYSAKADVWSAGVVALELLTGRQLFAGGDSRAVYARIRDFHGEEALAASMGESKAWQNLNQEGKRFIHWLLAVHPSQRPFASQALEHPWLQPHSTTEVCYRDQLARSLTSYARAKPVVRQCLHVLACQGSGLDIQPFDSAFVRADKNIQGHVSLREIARSCSQTECSFPSVDWSGVEAVGYTEFIAACLSTNYAKPYDLAVSTFKAIDVDRDGQISFGDIPDLISDHTLLKSLPQGRPFGLEDWVVGIHAASGVSSPLSPGRVTKLRLSVAGARFLATSAY